jgi:hypothetical protein
LEYNLLTARISALKRHVQQTEDEVTECSRRLAWYSTFDPVSEADSLVTNERDAGRIKSKLEVSEVEHIRQSTLAANLSRAAKLGLDPRWWFSAERRQHAELRDEARERLSQLAKTVAHQRAALANALEACKQRQARLDEYRTLDPVSLMSRRDSLESRLVELRQELTSFLAAKSRVDELLSPLISEQQDLTSRLARLEAEVKLAENFETRLSDAGNSYEKAMVHADCSKAFGGEGRPRAVMQNKQREMQALRRNLEKVEERLKRVGSLVSRPIATLVIDGNNLCYEGQVFIGLEPLHSLTHELDGSYQMIVVFDSSIRRLMRMNDQQVRYGFPTRVKVHIVASEQGADQTILELASAPDAYVISNDRFRDFVDQEAVRGKRLIRHEIVAGRLFVHDLSLAVAFKNDGHAPRVAQ